jgi:hypothetical protein
MSYEEIKNSRLQDFGKSINFWFLEEIEVGMKNKNVMGFTRRLFTITGYQSQNHLIRRIKIAHGQSPCAKDYLRSYLIQMQKRL